MSASVSQVAKMLTDCFRTASRLGPSWGPPLPPSAASASCTRCAPALIHSTRNPFGEGRLNKLYLKCPDLWYRSLSSCCAHGEFLFQHLRPGSFELACSNRIYRCRLEASLLDCSSPFSGTGLPFSGLFVDSFDHPRGCTRRKKREGLVFPCSALVKMTHHELF